MNRVNHVSDRYAYLKERNRYLEETYRSYVAIFDMLASSYFVRCLTVHSSFRRCSRSIS